MRKLVNKTAWRVKWLSFDQSIRESKIFRDRSKAYNHWNRINGMIKSGKLNASMAWIEPEETEVFVDVEFHVYDHIGQYIGKFEADKALNLVSERDWTLVEV